MEAPLAALSPGQRVAVLACGSGRRARGCRDPARPHCRKLRRGGHRRGRGSRAHRPPPLVAALRLPFTLALGFVLMLCLDALILLLASHVDSTSIKVDSFGSARLCSGP